MNITKKKSISISPYLYSTECLPYILQGVSKSPSNIQGIIFTSDNIGLF